jgi:hypothetical protein
MDTPAYLFASGFIFLIFGVPLIFVVRAMHRQLLAGNFSRWKKGRSVLGLATAFVWMGLGNLGRSHLALGALLLVGAAYFLLVWQISKKQAGAA